MKFVSILLLPAFIMAATPSFAPRDLSFGESLPLLAGYQPLSSVVLGNVSNFSSVNHYARHFFLPLTLLSSDVSAF